MRVIKLLSAIFLVVSILTTDIYCLEPIPLKEKLMVIVTPSYNNKAWWEWNLRSLIDQNYTNYYILITDDCSPDGTGTEIENYILKNNLSKKVILHKNKERFGALHNLYTMIHTCPNEAVIVTVDGDDALPDSEVLNRLNKIYSSQDVWLTYGQFIEHPSGIRGWCSPMPDEVVKNNTFREYCNLPSHLRTFYAWLFKSVKLEDMLYFGDFYSMTWDYVMMLPMIEMAAERHLCIQDCIMYVYNNANTISDHRISRQLQAYLAQVIRTKKRYTRLPSKLENFAQNLEQQKADFIIFSEDQDPALLDQFLTSLQEKVSGVGNIFVLYRPTPSNQEHYTKIIEKHCPIPFLTIAEDRSNFRVLLHDVYFYLLKNNYVIFALANNQVCEAIHLSECIQSLEETQAHSFSFRLSKENPCIPVSPRLALLEITPDICAWNFSLANDLWSCANNIEMTMYRYNENGDIARVLKWCNIYSSIDFLGWWAHEGNLDKIGLCFKYPKTRKLK